MGPVGVVSDDVVVTAEGGEVVHFGRAAVGPGSGGQETDFVPLLAGGPHGRRPGEGGARTPAAGEPSGPSLSPCLRGDRSPLWAIEGGARTPAAGDHDAGPVRLASLQRIETNRRRCEEGMRPEFAHPPRPRCARLVPPQAGGQAHTRPTLPGPQPGRPGYRPFPAWNLANGGFRRGGLARCRLGSDQQSDPPTTPIEHTFDYGRRVRQETPPTGRR